VLAVVSLEKIQAFINSDNVNHNPLLLLCFSSVCLRNDFFLIRDSMKPIFKNYSLQNLFVLCVGYFGLIFVRKSIQYWDDGELIISFVNGCYGYCLFGFLLGFPPFAKFIK